MTQEAILGCVILVVSEFLRSLRRGHVVGVALSILHSVYAFVVRRVLVLGLALPLLTQSSSRYSPTHVANELLMPRVPSWGTRHVMIHVVRTTTADWLNAQNG